jgi:hypothetical protein
MEAKKEWIDPKQVNDQFTFKEIFEALGITEVTFNAQTDVWGGNCPLHDKEKKNKRVWASDEKGAWRCYKCKPEGNVLEFVKLYKI